MNESELKAKMQNEWIMFCNVSMPAVLVLLVAFIFAVAGDDTASKAFAKALGTTAGIVATCACVKYFFVAWRMKNPPFDPN